MPVGTDGMLLTVVPAVVNCVDDNLGKKASVEAAAATEVALVRRAAVLLANSSIRMDGTDGVV